MTPRVRTLLPKVPLALTLCLSLPVQTGPDETRPILRELLSEGDRADPARFGELARFQTEKALKGLHSVAQGLRNPSRLREAYRAFLHFGDSEELLPQALELLARDALATAARPTNKPPPRP